MFMLARGNLTSEQMVQAFVAALPAMDRFVEENRGAWIVRINTAGEFTSKVKLTKTRKAKPSSSANGPRQPSLR